MRDYLIAMLAIPTIVLFWVIVQRIAKSFAQKHPEFGKLREEGSGCGSSCLCGSRSSCKVRNRRKKS